MKEILERPIPVGNAIHWTPVGLVGATPAYPIFFTQQALDAVHAQLGDLPEGASSLGFLVGGIYQTPDTHAPYIIVESTIHLPWSIGGDHLAAALRQGRNIAQEEVRRSDARLLGWYHSHVAPHARLSVSDVAAHVACFDQPWEVALVVARGTEGLTGGVFRIASRTAWSNEYLPFYELPSEGGATHLKWANYKTLGVELSTTLTPQVPAAAPPPLLFPADPDSDMETMPAPRRRALPAPLIRVVRFGALGVVAGAGVFGAYRMLSAGPGARANGSATGSAVMTAEGLDRLADTVSFAVTAFEIRLRLYDGRKMLCPDLANGLMELESRWIAHAAARKSTGVPVDSLQTARDRRLNADVDAAERGFARTGCARP